MPKIECHRNNGRRVVQIIRAKREIRLLFCIFLSGVHQFNKRAWMNVNVIVQLHTPTDTDEHLVLFDNILRITPFEHITEILRWIDKTHRHTRTRAHQKNIVDSVISFVPRFNCIELFAQLIRIIFFVDIDRKLLLPTQIENTILELNNGIDFRMCASCCVCFTIAWMALDIWQCAFGKLLARYCCYKMNFCWWNARQLSQEYQRELVAAAAAARVAGGGREEEAHS